MKSIAVIGNGKMAIDCLSIMREREDVNIALVLTEPGAISWSDSVASYCAKENIPFQETNSINSDAIVQKLGAIAPDLMFNINSYRIIKESLLSIPNHGIINFHNGPLPRYGGVHVCSWAIINGETEHGVTWHYVDRGIDTGDLIAQRFFAITPNETAVRLIMKCIREGIELFRDIFPRLIDEDIKPEPQDLTKTTYYSLRDIPHGGMVNFNWTYQEVDRFVRGLTFHPMNNNFVYPKSNYFSREFIIERLIKVEDQGSTTECGKILCINPEQINVQIKDAIIGILSVLDNTQMRLELSDFIESYHIRPGAYFES